MTVLTLVAPSASSPIEPNALLSLLVNCRLISAGTSTLALALAWRISLGGLLGNSLFEIGPSDLMGAPGVAFEDAGAVPALPPALAFGLAFGLASTAWAFAAVAGRYPTIVVIWFRLTSTVWKN